MMAAASSTPPPPPPDISLSRQLAQQWCQQDPNPTTAAYVQSLLQKDNNTNDNNNTNDDSQSMNELKRLFPPPNQGSRITFGTSGLRGRFQPGPLGMNDLVVVQTAQGLARYHEQQQRDEQQDEPLRVVIGYDHRAYHSSSYQLSSRQFALLTALVFWKAAGWKKENVIVLDGYLPTPLVPFACQHLKAPLGIMITASHNPAQDAGYKIYYHACQILSPRDAQIQNLIEQNLEPWIDYGALVQELQQQQHQQHGESSSVSDCWGFSHPDETGQIVDSYFAALSSSGLVTGQYAKYKTKEDSWLLLQQQQQQQKQQQKQQQQHRPLPLMVYTPMHGVGLKLAQRVFETFSLPAFAAVPQQQEPDPTFPTVPFPNPEERHALDLAKAYGLELLLAQQERQQHDQPQNIVILANDPDADRLAVAEYDAQSQVWTAFTGDQIGVLLGHWLWTQLGAHDNSKPVAMCQSLVSSRMLAEIGRVEGFRVDETLTGFKWIGSRAKELTDQGYNVLLAYEESIGYCCGNVVVDKDGISALGVFAELIVWVYGGGLYPGEPEPSTTPCTITTTLVQHLQSLYNKYGEFVSHNGYYFFHDPSVVELILNKMRRDGKYDLNFVGEYEIASIRDLGVPGYDSTTSDHRPILPTSRSSPMVTIRFTNGCVAQFRASGTEPKFKYYLEMKGAPGEPRHVVEQRLQSMAETILEILLEPSKHGLTTTTTTRTTTTRQ